MTLIEKTNQTRIKVRLERMKIMSKLKIKAMLKRRSTPICNVPQMCRGDHLSDEGRQDSACIIIPRVFHETRRYIPIIFARPDVEVGGLALIIPNASQCDFGVIASSIHTAWMRAVCDRLCSNYSYSKSVGYNNFPWPSPTDAQRAKIEQTAQAILDARALYPDMSMADLYDERIMPAELRIAHQANDRAVMDAYGIGEGDPACSSESACVAFLMRRYRELIPEIKVEEG